MLPVAFLFDHEKPKMYRMLRGKNAVYRGEEKFIERRERMKR